jgi:site-specific recombinase XerD
MADLILRVETNSELDGINHLKQLAKNGVGSAHSQRAYETAIEEFIAWSLHNGQIRINATQLRAYQSHLTARIPHHTKDNANDTPLAPSTVNVKMASVRALVHGAAAEGWIAAADEEQILKRLHSRPVTGRREGQRMPLADVQRCLRLPDRATLAGKRDYALLGVLFACGLRRAELCDLEVKTIGRLNEGWALIDLVGKRQKVRSVPLEAPIKAGIDEWLAAARIASGRVFRAVRKNGKVWGNGLDESAIWQIVRHYAARWATRTLPPTTPAARVPASTTTPKRRSNRFSSFWVTTSSTPPPATSTTSRSSAAMRSARSLTLVNSTKRRGKTSLQKLRRGAVDLE